MLKGSNLSSPSKIFRYSGDQFGYYTVGEKFKTYSKLLAIEEMKKTGLHLEWHFNREQYENYNWTKEPNESLEELYRKRAQELREKYDYIVLWYSGGADCDCILNTFLKNNIRIDEIAHIISHEADKDKHSNFNEEIFYTALPEMKKILEKHPEINHRIVDVSKIIDEIFVRPDVKFNFIYNIKGIASANSLARSYIREYVDDYKKIMDSGRRMCFLWGAEKPRLKMFHNKYHTCFIDVFSETNSRLQSLYSIGYFDEWFFWGPTTADIVCKQSHVLLKILKNLPDDSPWLTSQGGAHIPQTASGKYLRNDIYHTVIYPNWDPKKLVSAKPINLLIGERDLWFWKQNITTNKSVYNAHQGIKTLIDRVGRYWMNDPDDVSKGFKGCINTYALEQ
jgi:hypothetical protein